MSHKFQHGYVYGNGIWGMKSSEDSSTSDIGYPNHWLSKSITPPLTTVSVQLMPSFPFAPSPPIKIFICNSTLSICSCLPSPAFHNSSLFAFHSQSNSIRHVLLLLLLSLRPNFLHQSIHPPFFLYPLSLTLAYSYHFPIHVFLLFVLTLSWLSTPL